MKNKPKNIAESIKAKLYNYAKANNLNFNSVLIQYFQERLLYRISKSNYRSRFILKGALLFLAYDISKLRPTKDIDLLCKSFENDLQKIIQIFSEITEFFFNDGVVFQKDSITAEYISQNDKYHGIRIKLTAKLTNIKQILQIDIGFGDIIIPAPIEIEYPVLLDLESPKIFAYSVESAIAEKFEAIVSLGISTSRMKDFYDILFFANNRDFKYSILKKAITATFKARNTDIGDVKYVFSDSYKNDSDKQVMWKAYLNKRSLISDNDFKNVVMKIESFITAIMLSDVDVKKWNCKTFGWE